MGVKQQHITGSLCGCESNQQQEYFLLQTQEDIDEGPVMRVYEQRYFTEQKYLN